ncbi:MAG: arylamine N-acetyltransferase [Thermoleophilia bacterium]
MAPDRLDRYRERIGLPPRRGDVADAALLAEVVARQAAAIPFENLDIQRGRPASADPDDAYRSLVAGGRGGICYQLNGLLAAALAALGFRAAPIGARVADGERWGPPLGHMAVLVAGVPTAAGPRDHLVDAGFGGEILVRPLPASPPADGHEVRLGGGRYVTERGPRPLSDFEAMAWWHSTSPRSRFTGSLVCSIVDGAGRHTLSGPPRGPYRRTTTGPDGRRSTRELDARAATEELRRSFGIVDVALPLPGPWRRPEPAPRGVAGSVTPTA